MQTPWGFADRTATLAEGVIVVSTTSHGGVYLDEVRNTEVHPAWRDRGGWYEEDSEWAIAALTFPAVFGGNAVARAHVTAKNWYPDQYEQVFATSVKPAESYVRRRQIFEAENADKLVATAAWGAGMAHPSRETVPAGMTGVLACRGGRGARADANPAQWFLVPDDEYERRSTFGFIVDPHRHTPWPARQERQTSSQPRRILAI